MSNQIFVLYHGSNCTDGLGSKYAAWKGMKRRVNSPGIYDSNYKNVTYHPDQEKWENFDKDVPDPPLPNLTLDRIDNKGNYVPGNVRWATTAEQNRNKSNNRYVTINGRTQLYVDWCRELGINQKTVASRLRRGIKIEDALLTPVDVSKRNKRSL